MKAKTIIKHIQESALTSDEIREIWALLKAKSDTLRRVAVHSFSAGAYVKFVGKGGRGTLYGIVQKRNQKTLTIQVKGGNIWRVPPSMLAESSFEEYDEATAPIVLPARRQI